MLQEPEIALHHFVPFWLVNEHRTNIDYINLCSNLLCSNRHPASVISLQKTRQWRARRWYRPCILDHHVDRTWHQVMNRKNVKSLSPWNHQPRNSEKARMLQVKIDLRKLKTTPETNDGTEETQHLCTAAKEQPRHCSVVYLAASLPYHNSTRA